VFYTYFGVRNKYVLLYIKRIIYRKGRNIMRKNTLQDMKKENRRLIIKTLIEHTSLSRIELAQITKLSPSTVSGLVSDLLAEGVFMETGVDGVTGGRKRKGISYNGDFALIGIVEIRRTGTVFRVYDMALRERYRAILSKRYIAGDELFSAIISATAALERDRRIDTKKQMVIGLLFQEDMTPGEFSVIYSTSLSSDTISLKDALGSYFHIPIMEEYSQSFSIASILNSEKTAARGNAALITIGRKIQVSIAMKGDPLALKDGRKFFDITPLVREDPLGFVVLTERETGRYGRKIAPPGRCPPVKEKIRRAANALIKGLKPLCVLFQLDAIFLDGSASAMPALAAETEKILRKQLKPQNTPKIARAAINIDTLADNFAGNIRRQILLRA
jgi:predicted NBD/HSP70 family sugar kinase